MNNPTPLELAYKLSVEEQVKLVVWACQVLRQLGDEPKQIRHVSEWMN